MRVWKRGREKRGRRPNDGPRSVVCRARSMRVAVLRSRLKIWGTARVFFSPIGHCVGDKRSLLTMTLIREIQDRAACAAWSPIQSKPDLVVLGTKVSSHSSLAKGIVFDSSKCHHGAIKSVFHTCLTLAPLPLFSSMLIGFRCCRI